MIQLGKRFLLILFIIALSMAGAARKTFPAAKKEGVITGVVVRQETGEPLPLANVYLEGTVLGAATDRDGRFVIAHVQPGNYHLVCSAIGFRRQTRTIKITSNDTLKLTFRMHPTPVPMSRLVVTASKFQKSVEDVSVRMDLVTPEELSSRNATTLSEGLKYLPGVQVAGNNISIRGSNWFSYGLGTRTLVLLDGVPFVSGDENKVFFEAVPVSEIKQVEVMKGPGSALYGSSAMAGVINIITEKPATDSANIQLSLYSGVYDKPSYKQWRWNENYRSFRGTNLTYRNNFWGVQSSLTFNYNQNSNFKRDADYRNINFFGKFYFDVNPNNHWQVTAGMLQREAGGFLFWKDRDHALEPGNEPKDSFTRSKTDILYVHTLMTQTVSSKFYYQLRFNYRQNILKEIANPLPGKNPETVGLFRRTEGETYGHEMQFTYQWNARYNAVFGWNADWKKVDAIQYGKREATDASIYGQLSSWMTNAVKADLGVRWDVERIANVPTSSQVNPKLGVNFSLSKRSHLRFAVGRGFRAPSIGERFVSTYENQIKVLPNPDLKPESNVSAEVGFLSNLTDWWQFDVGYFYNDYENLIDPTLQSGELAVKFENVARAIIQGVELHHDFSFWRQRAQLSLGYVYLHTQDLSKFVHGVPNPNYGKDLKYRPNHSFTSRLTLSWHPFELGVDFRYLSKAKRVDYVTNIPDITRQVPTYVADVQLRYRRSNYAVDLIVNNLFQYYYLVSPGNMGDIRNVRLQLSWQLRDAS
ncbi:MAG: TonB-dependent receptor [Calditrichaeota bacterium]|nr:TonB-dependent receptor [Calditrichota bacterium]